jgi:glycosyltransferase involved in cell wall biosynthesis
MFGWEFPPFVSGGLGTACAGVAAALAERGHRVTFVAPAAEGVSDWPGVTLRGTGTCRTGADPYEVSGYGVVRQASHDRSAADSAQPGAIPGNATEGSASGDGATGAAVSAYDRPCRSLVDVVAHFAMRGRELGRDCEFDILHCHDWMSVVPGLELKRLTGRPLVFHVHSLEEDRTGVPSAEVLTIEQRALVSADAVITVSEYTRQRVLARDGVRPENVHVVHNGVSCLPIPRRHTRGVNFAPPLVLFSGRLTWQKGPEAFVEIARRIHRRLPRVEFAFVGQGDMQEQLVQAVRAAGLEGCFRFLGFLSKAELGRLFTVSSLLLVPSRSEPFGLVALEAAAAGLPVVISSQSGVREVLLDAPALAPDDLEAWAETSVAVLSDRRLARDLARRNREALAFAAWPDKAAEIEAVYRRLLEPRVPG